MISCVAGTLPSRWRAPLQMRGGKRPKRGACDWGSPRALDEDLSFLSMVLTVAVNALTGAQCRYNNPWPAFSC